MAQDPTPPFTVERLEAIRSIPTGEAPSPAYVVHLGLLRKNGELLREVEQKSGAKVLLALKGFACHAAFPTLQPYLSGTTSSGLHEALLAKDYFKKEIHVYSPAFKAEDLRTLQPFAHSIVFNSAHQLAAGLAAFNPGHRPEIGLRINPEYSVGGVDLYDPCSPLSRLGTTRENLDRTLSELSPKLLDHVDGLHFHTLCEQDADALEDTAEAFERGFGDLIRGKRWLNFGGGHHITRPGYDVERLCRVVRHFREKYDVDVYLEPGEAVGLQTGILVATVLDLFVSGGESIAILDISATCHMPDVLEMPYRPNILDAGAPKEHPHEYLLGGMSCLAGDVIGKYSFERPLSVGDRLTFLDMAHYTMVKTTTFNGVPLPAICLFDAEKQKLEVIKKFGYADYRDRLS